MLNEYRIEDWKVGSLAPINQLAQKNSLNNWTFVDYNGLVFEDLGNGTRRTKLTVMTATLKAGETNPENAFQIGSIGDYLYIDPSNNLTIVSEKLAKILR